mmetsp:Transcript_46504/g.141141  ORF Transcript_46504/g.141141 Transcript_46504/m.141141 type:complete len:325 (+) Transcript_46504:6426-7400(+)
MKHAEVDEAADGRRSEPLHHVLHGHQTPRLHEHDIQLPAGDGALDVLLGQRGPVVRAAHELLDLGRLLVMVHAVAAPEHRGELVHLALGRRAHLDAPLVLAGGAAGVRRHGARSDDEVGGAVRDLVGVLRRGVVVAHRRPPLEDVLGGLEVRVVHVDARVVDRLAGGQGDLLQDGAGRLLRHEALRQVWLLLQVAGHRILHVVVRLPPLHEAAIDLDIASAVGVHGQQCHWNLLVQLPQMRAHRLREPRVGGNARRPPLVRVPGPPLGGQVLHDVAVEAREGPVQVLLLRHRQHVPVGDHVLAERGDEALLEKHLWHQLAQAAL